MALGSSFSTGIPEAGGTPVFTHPDGKSLLAYSQKGYMHMLIATMHRIVLYLPHLSFLAEKENVGRKGRKKGLVIKYCP